MQTRIPDIKPGIEFLKYYQIAGGVIGIGLIVPYLIGSAGSLSGLVLLIVFCFIALYSFSVYCGLLLFRNLKRALAFSRINQIFQLLSFTVLGFTFRYVSGLYAFIGFELSGSLGLNFNFGLTSWQVNINGNKNDLVVNINLVAFLLIVVIEKLLNRIRLKEHSEIIAALGEPVKEDE